MMDANNNDDRQNQQSEDEFDSVNRRTFLGAAAGTSASVAIPTLPNSATTTPASPDPVRSGDESARQTVTSPDNNVTITVDVTGGTLKYSLDYEGKIIIEPSTLGFEFENAPSLDDDFTVTGSNRKNIDYSWEPVWGRYDNIRNNYNRLTLGVQERSGQQRSLTLVFRAYNDGVGFRYTFPKQESLNDFTIAAENTEFRFVDDYTTWWMPLQGGDRGWNEYELTYEETPLSVMDEAHTPVTMVGDELSLSVHEAALTDYASMALSSVDRESTTIESTLAPLPNTDSKKVVATTPHHSPWRTIQLGSRPGDLIESSLIVNLNEPQSDLFSDDQYGTDWIEPQKFMGVWWLMITGRATWDQGITHGATTERAKRYMDFASDHGIPSLLVEGWNIGWDDFTGDELTEEGLIEEDDDFDFINSYDDYNLKEVIRYGQSLDPSVNITIHNETGGAVDNYETQLDEAFDYYEQLGIHTNKTGYVADIPGVTLNDELHYHHDQAMVNHYERVTREGAKHEIMFEIHEPIKPTGKRRTYPNLMTREGLKGQEFDAFGDLPPSHHATLPFTRMLGGPMEFTPGMFNLSSGSGGINTTRAKQLAMYPVYFSGLQMVADTPEAYENEDGEVHPEFEFIEHVPTSWDDTTVLNASVSEYVTIARQNGKEWYVGSMTAGATAVDVSLKFLAEAPDKSKKRGKSHNDGGRSDNGKGHTQEKYVAQIYTDGADAMYTDSPNTVCTEETGTHSTDQAAVAIDEVIVDPTDTIVASMIESGGQAIRLTPATTNDLRNLPAYESPDQQYEAFSVPGSVDTPASFDITVTGTNTGNVVGGERLYVYVNGKEVASNLVRFGSGEDQDKISVKAALGPGEYQVTVGTSKENTLPPRKITVESE
jgi:hypothetical protein